MGQALDSLAKVSSPVTGAALALVLLVDPPNSVVGVPDEAGKRGEWWGVTGNATRMLSCVFPGEARSACVFASRMSANVTLPELRGASR